MKRYCLLFLLCVAAIPPAAHAQEDSLLYRLPTEVIITAPRMRLVLNQNPAATTVVGPAEMPFLHRAIAVDEALLLVPGVHIENQADGSRVHLSIRGQGILTERGIRGTTVLLDGLPLNDPTGFVPDFYDIDWSAVRSVEVQRGPSAALYGGGSSAGVLSISTIDGASPFGGAVEFSAGSNGFWKSLAQAGGGTEALNYRLSLSRMAGDGYRQHQKFWGNIFSGKLRWTPSEKLRITPLLEWSDYFNENAEGLNLAQVAVDPKQANPDAGPYNEYQRTGRFTGGASGEWKFSDEMHLRFAASFRRTLYLEPVPSSVQHRAFATPALNLQATRSDKIGSVVNTLSVGADLCWQTIDEWRHPNLGGAREGSRLLSDQTITQSGAGFFLVDRIEFSPAWSVLLSARSDEVKYRLKDRLLADGVDLSGDAEFHETSGRIGLAWIPSAGMSAYINWGEGFLPPATEELANNPDQFGGFNKGLLPATSRGGEIGLRGTHGEQLYYDAALFLLNSANDFDRYRIAARPLETFYRNSGRSRRYGFEALVRWMPISALSLHAAYTWSLYRYTDPSALDGNRLPNSPEHQLALEAQYEIMPRLRIGCSAYMQSKWYVDKENSVPPVDGYALIGARIAYELKLFGLGAEVTLSGRNLADRKWIAFTEPDPDGNSYQPGPGRELFAGLRISF